MRDGLVFYKRTIATEIVLAKLRYHLSRDDSKVGDNLHGDHTLIFQVQSLGDCTYILQV